MVVSHGGSCVSLAFNEHESKITVEYPVHLQGCHEEADTLLAFHAANAIGNLVIRASATDVMVILLGMLGRHMESHKEASYNHSVMDCGSGNNRRYIDITSIATALESTQRDLLQLCQASMPSQAVTLPQHSTERGRLSH